MKKNKLLTIILMITILIWAVYTVGKSFFGNNFNNNFTIEARKVYKTAVKQYRKDAINGENSIVYLNGLDYDDVSNAKGLTIRGNSAIQYLVLFNTNGDVSYFKVVGNKYEMELGNIDGSSIVELEDITDEVVRNKISGIKIQYDQIEMNYTSNNESRGYVVDAMDDSIYVTIYFGKTKDNVSISSVVSDNGVYTIWVNTTSSNDNEINTPSIKIKIDGIPTSLVVQDTKGNEFYELKTNNSYIEEETITEAEKQEIINFANCDNGEYLDTELLQCLKCPNNTYSKNGDNKCSVCPTNTCSSEGSSSCKPCTN